MLLAVVALASAAWWLARDRGARRDVAPASPIAAMERRASVALDAAPILREPGEEPGLQRAPASSGPHPLDGRIRMIDGTSVSGSLEILHRTAGGATHLLTIPVEDDAWRLEAVRAGDGLLVRALELDGRVAFPLRAFHVVGGEEPLVIEADWKPTDGLRVVDAETWEELSEVEVLQCESWRGVGLLPHPGTAGAAGIRETTPLETSHWWGFSRHLVTAPGYAWGSVRKSWGQTPPTLALRKGCELVVRVEGPASLEEPARLVLRDTSRPPAMPAYILEVPALAGEQQFRHLEAGIYEASLKREGPSGAPACTLAPEQSVVLSPGKAGQLVFTLAPATAAALVSGIVRPTGSDAMTEIDSIQLVPMDLSCGEGARQRITLRVARESSRTNGEATLSRGADGTVSWEPIALSPGQWWAIVLPLGYSVPFTVPVAPSHQLNLWLPAPLELSVRVADRAGNPRAFHGMIVSTVRPQDGSWNPGAPLPGVVSAPGDPMRVLAYPGIIRFLALLDGGPRTFERELHASGEVLLECDDRVGVTLRAWAYGQSLDLPWSLWSTSRVRTNTGEEIVGWSMSYDEGQRVRYGDPAPEPFATKATIHLPAPGSYVVELMGVKLPVILGPAGGDAPELVFDLSGVAGL